MLYALQGVPIKVTVAISGEETVLAGLDRAKDKFQADKEHLNENSIGHGNYLSVSLYLSFLFSVLFLYLFLDITYFFVFLSIFVSFSLPFSCISFCLTLSLYRYPFLKNANSICMIADRDSNDYDYIDISCLSHTKAGYWTGRSKS